MKTLDQAQMNNVSGAGSASLSVNYHDYETFPDYLVTMRQNHIDPLAAHVPGVRAAYTKWAKDFHIDACDTAKINGWDY